MEFVPRLWAAAAIAGRTIDLRHHQVDILCRGLRIQVILTPLGNRTQLGLYEREARTIPDDLVNELAAAILPGGRKTSLPTPRKPIPGLPPPGPWMRGFVGDMPNLAHLSDLPRQGGPSL